MACVDGRWENRQGMIAEQCSSFHVRDHDRDPFRDPFHDLFHDHARDCRRQEALTNGYLQFVAVQARRRFGALQPVEHEEEVAFYHGFADDSWRNRPAQVAKLNYIVDPLDWRPWVSVVA